MFPTYSHCVQGYDLFHDVADFFKFGLVCQWLLLKPEKIRFLIFKTVLQK